MNRRHLLFAMAAAGLDLKAQEPAPGSLYIPKPHLVEDRKLLQDFMDEFAFADLVTASPGIRITHIPTFINRAAGSYGTVFGHISRQNPQNKCFDGSQPAVIVFRGPHSYISPTWYTKPESVPTWNFAVVHATGRLKPIADTKSHARPAGAAHRQVRGARIELQLREAAGELHQRPHRGHHRFRDADRVAGGQVQTGPGAQRGGPAGHCEEPASGQRAHDPFRSSPRSSTSAANRTP
jgi:predicted FMN-binding regulatory protein PaiB